jgi:hypothetical protein
MRTFDLMLGTARLTLSDAGVVTKSGTVFGTWTTNGKSQIVVSDTGGASTAIDVDWRFDADNHLCIDKGGAQVFDINGDSVTTPALRLDRAVLFVRPIDTAPFEFSIRPTWGLTNTHDLTMTVNGKTSTLDGVINDRNSAFRFRFVDRLDVIETFSLQFKGEWRNSPDPTRPAAVVYEYEIEGSAAPGVFTLPNALVVDNNSLVLAYNYDKDGRTQSTQLVGHFGFTNFELSFAIERKTAAEGTSTTLKFDVDVKGRSADGKVVFALKRTDTGAITTTELAVGGKFTARFKSGVLIVGLTFAQRAINGTVASRELTFSGKLVHKGGAEFVWELKAANGTTAIGIGLDQIQLGAVTIGTKVNLVMSGGETKAVQALFGVSF